MDMRFAVYNLEDGCIRSFCSTPADHVFTQLRHGEEFYLNCSYGMTHIIGNKPITIVPEVVLPTAAELLSAIRIKRNARLIATDWTQMTDTPLASEKKTEWAAYRQLLRDFPETCDTNNPVWPVAPV